MSDELKRNIEQEIQSTKPNVKFDPEDEEHNAKWAKRLNAMFPTVTPEQMRKITHEAVETVIGKDERKYRIWFLIEYECVGMTQTPKEYDSMGGAVLSGLSWLGVVKENSFQIHSSDDDWKTWHILEIENKGMNVGE